MFHLFKKYLGNPEKKDDRSIAERIAAIRKAPLPKHVAIIKDGNGRWAKKRGLPRIAGHTEGIKRVREIIRAVDEVGIPILTFYSFSTENWKRPEQEIDYLMMLPREFLKTDLQELMERNVKVCMLGVRNKIPAFTQAVFYELEEKTQHNTGLILNFAVNYGSRDEIVRAIHHVIDEVEKGNIGKEHITEETLEQYLLTKGLPDPDLLIRPGGEIRISNFLLWQIAYSELWFTDVLWPDFTTEVFYRALADFQRRSRRYGMV
jgi:undecaprenyl diphosphate synthase